MLQRLRRRLFWPFVLPAFALYTIVLFLPMVQTVFYSFTDRSLKAASRFVGLKNYTAAFHDPFFWMSMRHTLVYTVLSLFMLFIPALFLAWSLAQPIRFKRFFRAVIFAPVVVSVLVTSLIWKFLLNPNWGLLNAFLKEIGLGSLALPWLGNPYTALVAVTAASVWHSLGLYVLLISAGFERIPSDLFDAAKVDGANDRQQFMYVSLPLLWQVLRSLIVLWTLHAIQAFAWVFVMTQGGPMNTTEVAATYVYSIAFVSNKYGYATALATLMMLVIFAVIWFANRLNKQEAYEF